MAHYYSRLISFLTLFYFDTCLDATDSCTKRRLTDHICERTHTDKDTLRAIFPGQFNLVFSIPLSCHNGISGQMDRSVSPVCWSWLEGLSFKTCRWPQVVALTFLFFPLFFFFLSRLTSYFSTFLSCWFTLCISFLFFLLFALSHKYSLFVCFFWLAALVVAVLWPLQIGSNIRGLRSPCLTTWRLL